jgi:hypothetical protein
MHDLEKNFQVGAAEQTETMVIQERPGQDDRISTIHRNDTLHLPPWRGEGMTLGVAVSELDPSRAYWTFDDVPQN